MNNKNSNGFDAMGPLVSVIVPVYKVENYIRRCIDSIISQTYKNIEVILVDDGSPDNCGTICDGYAETFPWIKVLHQSNQGQAVARNHGVKISGGELITFIDSDDFVEPDYIEYLLKLIIKHGADISIGGYRYVYENGHIPIRSWETKETLMNKEEALNCLNYTIGYGAVCWAKMFRRKLIIEHPFPEGQIYEDLAILYKIFYDAVRVAYGGRVIYYWVQRSGSTMKSPFNEAHMAGIDATREQMDFMKERCLSVLPSAKARHMAKIMELMPNALKSQSSRDAFKRLQKEMEYFLDVMIDKRVKTSLKLRIFSVWLGYYPAKMTFALHEELKILLYSK